MTTEFVRHEQPSPAAAPKLGPLPRRNIPMLMEHVFPVLRSLIELGYFSLEVEGAQHVPGSGPMIYVGNHSGWFTLDTLFGAIAVTDNIGSHRLPWGAVQDQLLKAPKVGRFFEAMGGFPASWLRTPQAMPSEMEVFSVYPEGADGNCKSFIHAYQMRPWRTGFLRMAAVREAAIVPVAIIGGEQCLPSALPLNAAKTLFGTTVPVPLSLIPLPTRWKMVFHQPIYVGKNELGGPGSDPAVQQRRARELTDEIRSLVQRTLDRETADHKLVKFSRFVRGELSVAEAAGALSSSFLRPREGVSPPRAKSP